MTDRSSVEQFLSIDGVFVVGDMRHMFRLRSRTRLVALHVVLIGTMLFISAGCGHVHVVHPSETVRTRPRETTNVDVMPISKQVGLCTSTRLCDVPFRRILPIIEQSPWRL
jgi:hypothetical protein